MFAGVFGVVGGAKKRRRLPALLLVPVLLISGFLASSLVSQEPAHAAGDAQLLVDVKAVHHATGETLTGTGWGQNDNRVAFQVDFSCLRDTCENVTVRFDPTQLDPNHDFYRLLHQSGFTPPATGGTINGSAAAGYTISLGTLQAGQSGSFTVVYSLASRPGDRVAWRDGDRNGWAVANFPIGFEIVQGITISSDTAVGPVSAASSPVIWENVIPNPGVTVDGPPNLVETDVDYTYRVYQATGCTHAVFNAVWGRVVRSDPWLCAESFEVVHQLPPGVELVAAEGNPVVTGSVATGLILTWDSPEWTPRNNAEGGWQSLTSRSQPNGASPRDVTVRFPRKNFSPEGQTCNYDATSAAFETSTVVTYIGMPGEDGQQRTATNTRAGVTVRCVEPFGKATADRKLSTFDGLFRPNPAEALISVPVDGAPDNLHQWSVVVANQANVDGVAVVTDNTLDLADAPVYRIETTPSGATVEWTATNGIVTLSGTSTSPVEAPEGFRFATAVITSPRLAGPNQFEHETRRTNFTVNFLYRVSSTAPRGERRTDMASAVVTYPDHPELADIPLSIPPHTIIFMEPFGQAQTLKYVDPSNGRNAAGDWLLNIPSSGTLRSNWIVQVENEGNVPGVPIIEEDSLTGPAGLLVDRIHLRYHDGRQWHRAGGTVEYTLDNGETATVTVDPASGDLFAPAGRHFVSVRIVGQEIGAANVVEGATNRQTVFRAHFNFAYDQNAPPDAVETNEVTTTMTYPDYPDLEDIVMEREATVRLVPPSINYLATVGVDPLPGGATAATPETDVTFSVGGRITGVAPTRDVTPQYVFAAPEGWTITPDSARFPAGSVPDGVRFTYRTATINGVERQIVVASWPEGTVFGENVNLPVMRVDARPGLTVPAGTISRPDAFIGDTNAPLPTDVFVNTFNDGPDIDGDGVTEERFARADNNNAGVQMGRVPGMQVLKEICLPDPDAADGCEWVSDPDVPAAAPPNTTSVRYRISVINTGNSSLNGITGYDVLPYPGDTGTSDATGENTRGSNIRMNVSGVSNISAGLEVTYSGADQPCRPEVDNTVPGCVDDWQADPSGAQAIRVHLPGELAAGQSVSMQYEAAVLGSPGFGAIGCNSFAVSTTSLATVSEPRDVCVTIEETDLMIVAGTPMLQVGRPGVLPFTVTNLGGADVVRGEVEITIPVGLTVTSLSFDGWQCTAVDAAGNPVTAAVSGAAVLTCVPDDALVRDEPRALNVPVIADVREFEVVAEVSSRMFDGDPSNNTATMSVSAVAAPGDIEVTKDDGVEAASLGDELTYTITATNPLAFETITGATLTDALPAGTQFVSASDGGMLADGVVTWSLAAIPALGSVSVTLTLRVLPTIATAELENLASITAPDPAFPDETLMGSGADVDAVVTNPQLTLTKASVTDTYSAVGDVVTYTFTAENSGDVSLRGITITDPLPGLSEIVYVWPGEPRVLAPGQVVTATATYTVTQQDLDNTRIVNTATVTGQAPNGDDVSDEDTLAMVIPAGPEVRFDKTAQINNAGVWRAGDTVTYHFRIENRGNVTLTGVIIGDPLPGLSEIVYVWPGEPGVLAAGEVVTATASYLLTTEDAQRRTLTNVATLLTDQAEDVTAEATLSSAAEVPDALAGTGDEIRIALLAGGAVLIVGLLIVWLTRRRRSGAY